MTLFYMWPTWNEKRVILNESQITKLFQATEWTLLVAVSFNMWPPPHTRRTKKRINKLPIVGGWKSGNDKHVYIGCIPYCVGYEHINYNLTFTQNESSSMGHDYWYCKAITGSFYGPTNGMLNFLNSCLGIETKM